MFESQIASVPCPKMWENDSTGVLILLKLEYKHLNPTIVVLTSFVLLDANV